MKTFGQFCPILYLESRSTAERGRMESLFMSTVPTNVPNGMVGFLYFSMDREEACGDSNVKSVAKGGERSGASLEWPSHALKPLPTRSLFPLCGTVQQQKPHFQANSTRPNDQSITMIPRIKKSPHAHTASAPAHNCFFLCPLSLDSYCFLLFFTSFVSSFVSTFTSSFDASSSSSFSFSFNSTSPSPNTPSPRSLCLSLSPSPLSLSRALSVSHSTKTNFLHSPIDISLGHFTVSTITLLDQHCT